MNRRDHDRLIKPLCKQLNALIPIKGTENRDKINALIAKVDCPDFCLYWGRDFYLDCNGDREELRRRTLHSGIVHFEPSDDPTERPGITVRYNQKKISEL